MGILDFLRARKVDANEIADVARDDWSPPPMSVSSSSVPSWGDWLEEPDVELEEIEETSIDPELAELAARARRPVTGPLPRAEAMAVAKLASAAPPPPPPMATAVTKPKAIVAPPTAAGEEDALDIPAYLLHLTPEERAIIRAQQDSAARDALSRASRPRPRPRRLSRPRLRSTLGVRKGRERASAVSATPVARPIAPAGSFREHLTEEELAIIASQQGK